MGARLEAITTGINPTRAHAIIPWTGQGARRRAPEPLTRKAFPTNPLGRRRRKEEKEKEAQPERIQSCTQRPTTQWRGSTGSEESTTSDFPHLSPRIPRPLYVSLVVATRLCSVPMQRHLYVLLQFHVSPPFLYEPSPP